MILLLVGLLIEQDISRNRIESQEEITARTEDRTRPLLEAARPLIEDARELSPSVRAAAQELRTSLRSLPTALDSVEDVAVRLPHLIAAGSTALEAVNRTGLVADTSEVLRRVERENFIHDGARAARSVPALVKLQKRLLNVQLRSYALLVESQDTQRQLLSTQIEALRHVRSLDLKTGGTVSP